ncbi:birA, biotin-[acetyl-CoA-carboxylase] ligase region [Chelatococcus sambhunathii]|uniref:biotin--[biotin carboxyl-carrier protein] ligase n=1 Tax=Chelatococcus sambhunathii TaxID=363953 RepID=A0ABM9U4D2_9HYPH|nr:biotin--[acetyl-CoA-carboxylase] ligase [Chelatococcus sambhunathii]CUA86334.1 birA, biotin-[acetyl-CoA-carboxylase] ligase region [Chelatococcus sambhunathii]
MERGSISQEARDAGFDAVMLATTTSTNDEALERASSQGADRLWVVAREQTSGRGRHGRQWASPPGNLYASLVLSEPCDPPKAPQLGFVAGLALHDAVAGVTGLAAPRLVLKWPNDLLMDGGKLSGLILEGHRLGPDRHFAVIIGMGLNVAHKPADTPYPARCLAEAVGTVDVSDVFRALSASFAYRLRQWDRGLGFALTREAWLARAAGIGGPARVRLPGGDLSGTFAGLDSAGRLLLDTPDGRRTIDAGDLYLGLADMASQGCD